MIERAVPALLGRRRRRGHPRRRAGRTARAPLRRAGARASSPGRRSRSCPPDDPRPLARAVAALDALRLDRVRQRARGRRRRRAPAQLATSRPARRPSVGRATAARRASAPDFASITSPSASGAAALLAELRAAGGWPRARVLLPASSIARPELADGLAALGATVDRVDAYRIRPRGARCRRAAAPRSRAGAVDVVTFTSPSAVASLVERARRDGGRAALRDRLVVSIGPTTTRALRASAGLAASAEARPSTLDGVVAAHASRRRRSPRASRPRVRESPRRMSFPAPAVRAACARTPPGARWSPRRASRRADSSIRSSSSTAPTCATRWRACPGSRSSRSSELVAEARRAHELGVPAVILFGIPETKDAVGSAGYDPDGIVPRAIRALKRELPELLVWADVCLCEYTEPRPLRRARRARPGAQRRNAAAPRPRRAGLRRGGRRRGGAERHDGRPRRRDPRRRSTSGGFAQLPIVAYAAKYASAYYGPFREAAGSTPAFGDRKALSDGSRATPTRRCARWRSTSRRAPTS